MVAGVNQLLDLDKTQKIMLALQDNESLLKYTANIPTVLMPEVLAFPLQQIDYPLHKHLNIVYLTMRWWNIPLLNSYHNCVKTKKKRQS